MLTGLSRIMVGDAALQHPVAFHVSPNRYAHLVATLPNEEPRSSVHGELSQDVKRWGGARRQLARINEVSETEAGGLGGPEKASDALTDGFGLWRRVPLKSGR
ncbi:hypothetical protein [Cognatishimia sp. F0-27]|uniref:hypothetical protein n=1 Tax=Cognatishimia sp. F0-27 TaxID=2816855 RepID=UPI001D0C3435|nr:hypothetical protein [Cognatishimia sp. F0-27]MCC1493067.1 hypothetical protein [Cognatishimia sp. F0-27]